MEIKQLFIKSFQRVSEATINIGGNVLNFIQGENEAGKTSILNACKKALVKGAKVTNPIKQGEDYSIIEITSEDPEIGQIRITETITSKKSELEIEFLKTGDVLRGTKARDWLFDKVEALAGNPQDIFKGAEKDVLGRIARLLLGDDEYEIWKEDRQEIYDGRTTANRKEKEFSAKLKVRLEPVEAVDVTALQDELSALTEGIEDYNGVHQEHENEDYRISCLQEDIKNRNAKIKELEQEIAEIHDSITAKVKAQKQREEYLSQNAPDKAKIEEIHSRIASAADTNVKAEQYKTYEQNRKSRLHFKQLSQKLTEQIESHDKKLILQLQEAGLPEGFGINEDGQLVDNNDMPIENWANSVKMKFGYMIVGKVLANKDIKFLLIQDAHNLDDKKIKELAEWAAEHEVTILAETVRDLGTGNLIKIEEGVVK